MLYEVITIDGATLDFTTTGKASRGISCDGDMTVITSYSIHYTKLYDTATSPVMP